MAAGLMQHRLETDGLDGKYEVRSVGTWAMEGVPAAPGARYVMAERGIDLTQHRARSIDREAVSAADLILVMTEVHREALVAEFVDARSKVYLLSEMIGKRYDIADPYGASLAHYEYCAEDLASIIEAGYQRILSLTAGTSQ